MFAAGRVAPALRGRQSCRTNDRPRPTARRTSSGRVVRLLRHAACRTGGRAPCLGWKHPTPAPDSPARQQAAEVKMVRYITISSGTAQRLSEKWRHFACTSAVITFCSSTSPFCVGVAGAKMPQNDQSETTTLPRNHQKRHKKGGCAASSILNFLKSNAAVPKGPAFSFFNYYKEFGGSSSYVCLKGLPVSYLQMPGVV